MTTTSDDVIRRFKEYDFDGDNDFREGLAQILEDVAGRPEEEKGETVGRAKTFYFSKITGSAISWEDVQATSSDEPRPLTFAEISELIQTGQTHLIPNNKEIPGGTNTQNPSESQVIELPKKPWER